MKLYGSAFLVLTLLSNLAIADGSHGTKITVTNNASGRIKADVMSGDDSICAFGHKGYTIEKNSSKTVKCHGKGKQRCKMRLGEPGASGGSYQFYLGDAKDGSEVSNSRRTLSCVIVKKGEKVTCDNGYSGIPQYRCVIK